MIEPYIHKRVSFTPKNGVNTLEWMSLPEKAFHSILGMNLTPQFNCVNIHRKLIAWVSIQKRSDFILNPIGVVLLKVKVIS